jgi:hypothetical protein
LTIVNSRRRPLSADAALQRRVRSASAQTARQRSFPQGCCLTGRKPRCRIRGQRPANGQRKRRPRRLEVGSLSETQGVWTATSRHAGRRELRACPCVSPRGLYACLRAAPSPGSGPRRRKRAPMILRRPAAFPVREMRVLSCEKSFGTTFRSRPPPVQTGREPRPRSPSIDICHVSLFDAEGSWPFRGRSCGG